MAARGRSALRRLDDTGASAVEYGLLVVAIAALIVAVTVALGAVTKANFSGTCDSIAIEQGDTGC